MNEIVNTGKTNQDGAEKIFTQSDVNRIIGERLSRDKLKNSEELEKRESELAARELKFIAKQLLAEKGLPSELAEIIRLDTEETIAEAVELLAKLTGSVAKEKDSKIRIVNEKKLPVGRNEDEDYGQLRRAFGLV